MKTRIFSVLCENVPGVMMRISRTFTRRQINLDSITVGLEPTGLARIILMFKEDDRTAEFMRRVLNKKQLLKMVQQIERAGGRVLESKGNMVIAELSGEHDEIERVIKALGPKILKEVARSGQVLISRVK
ncbi:Acetolactate synthase small subunit [subsurface metagenome]